MNVFWVDYASLFPVQDRLASIFIKKSLVSPVLRMPAIDTKQDDFALVAGILDNSRILIWAKPGILKDDYIKLLENLFIDMGVIYEGFCWEISCLATKCMQHALSKVNKHVSPALDQAEIEFKFPQIEMDEF